MRVVSNDPNDLADAESMVGVDVSDAGGTPDQILRLVTNVVNELLRSRAINGKFACVVRSDIPKDGATEDRVCALGESMGVKVCRDPVVIAIHSTDRRAWKSSGDERVMFGHKQTTKISRAERFAWRVLTKAAEDSAASWLLWLGGVLGMDATAIKTKTEELRGLQTRYEKAIRYSIALQRAIEYHCRGEMVPDRVAEGCPHHAAKLNARLQMVTSEA